MIPLNAALYLRTVTCIAHLESAVNVSVQSVSKVYLFHSISREKLVHFPDYH